MEFDDDEIELTEALRGAYAHRGEVSPEAEAVVLGAAREKFGRRRRLRMMARWGAGVAAAGLAAMIAIGVYVSRTPAPVGPVAKVVESGDVNGDGRVDMVDALLLAKRLKAGEKGEAGWDLNGDGVVDSKDADAIAVAAVRLKQGGVAGRSLPRFEALGLAGEGKRARRADGADAAAAVSIAPGRRAEGRQ